LVYGKVNSASDFNETSIEKKLITLKLEWKGEIKNREIFA